MVLDRCAHEGCDRPPSHAPKVMIPMKGQTYERERAFEVMLSLPCCYEHAVTFDGGTFIGANPKHASTIRRALQAISGGPVPDFDRAVIEPVPLTSNEYRTFIEGKRDG